VTSTHEPDFRSGELAFAANIGGARQIGATDRGFTIPERFTREQSAST